MKVVRILACLAAVGLLVSVLGAAGCAQPVTKKGPAEEVGLPVSLAAAADKGLVRLWQTDFLLTPQTSLTKFWLCGKYIIGCGSDNRIYCASARTGVNLWAFKAALPFQTVWQPTVDKDTVYVATTTRLIGIDALSGQETISKDLPFTPAGRPITNGVHCFMADAKGWLQAVPLLPRTVAWGRVTADALTATPVMDSNYIYFAGQNGVVYASQQDRRHIAWEHKTEGAVVGDLQRTPKGLILAASLDYTLYAFQGPSGRTMWRYEAGEPIRKTPYAVGKQVFVFTKGAGLTVLDAGTGRQQWTLADGADFLSADLKIAYILSRSGNILIVNRADGKVTATLTTVPGAKEALNQTENGAFYVASPTGKIVVLARKGLAEEKKSADPEETQPAVKKPAPKAPAAGALPGAAPLGPAAPGAAPEAAPAAPAPAAPAAPEAAPAAPAAPVPAAPAPAAPEAAPAAPAPAAPAPAAPAA